MQQVKIYIEIDSSILKATEKYYGYVIEMMVSDQPVTREGFGKTTGTYHQAILAALIAALGRFNQSCEVCVCAEDLFVLNMLEFSLAAWAGNEFLNSKQQPIANQQEWMEIWRLSNKHLILTEPGKHEYSSWLQGEIRKQKEEEGCLKDSESLIHSETSTSLQKICLTRVTQIPSES